MDKVNLFLIGAQKSGSTALAGYLSQHPSISTPIIKAPNFFNTRYYKSFQIKNIDEYLGLYDFSKTYQLDPSDCYHSDVEALKKIKKYNCNARIVMIIREPASMLRSLHQHLLWTGHEDEPNLNIAFSLVGDRRNGSNIPKGCIDPTYLKYSEMCNVGEQVRMILELFDRKNVFFVSSRQLKENKFSCVDGIFQWLSLDNVELNDALIEKNVAVVPRYKLLTTVNNMVSPKLKTYLKLKLGHLGVNLEGIMRKVNGKKNIVSNNNALVYSDEILHFCDREKQLIRDLIQMEL